MSQNVGLIRKYGAPEPKESVIRHYVLAMACPQKGGGGRVEAVSRLVAYTSPFLVQIRNFVC